MAEPKELENLLECNIYIEGVDYPIVSRIFLHRKTGGFSRIPAFAIIGKRDDVVSEMEYQLKRIGYNDLLKKMQKSENKP